MKRPSFLAQRDLSGEQEWMDLPGQNPADLATMFTDLQRVNRWLGGAWMTTRGLDRIFREYPAGEAITILDVASGSVDIPRVMSAWACRRKRAVSIVATDINPDVLRLAHGSNAVDGVQLMAADALHLPFADDAVDVAACSFFLHHLDPPDVVAALMEMRRVSRGSVLINDMVRGWPSFAGAWLFSRVFTRNPISRHDAPLSARRSYTRAELLDMAAAAGLEPMATYGFAAYRVVLVTTDSLPVSRTNPATLAVAAATQT
ncbi:MAG: methyltransferase domain-containing protein [Chloroflexota bacterium]|nr:methyltransferase domain-containing protein [Chloroflexota bacterium]